MQNVQLPLNDAKTLTKHFGDQFQLKECSDPVHIGELLSAMHSRVVLCIYVTLACIGTSLCRNRAGGTPKVPVPAASTAVAVTATTQRSFCCAGSCRALPILDTWHIPWWHGRSLQQRAAKQQATPGTTGRGVPMCMWNDVKESCSPSQLVFLALDATPSTILHRCADQCPPGQSPALAASPKSHGPYAMRTYSSRHLYSPDV
jgi:hypothetical protein